MVAEWRHQQNPADLSVQVAEDFLVDEHTPELDLDIRLSQERLQQALAELSTIVRVVLLLRLRDGYSSQEISRKLGLTDSEVKRCLARGYDHLRRAMES